MPGPRILVVDDLPENLKFARLLLQSKGYAVSTSPDAEDALRRIRRRRPRLLLLDVQLPGMDGFELTAQLKADPATKGIAIVLVTAAPSPAGRAKARSAGADGYVSKPIDTRTLPRLLARLLARKKR